MKWIVSLIVLIPNLVRAQTILFGEFQGRIANKISIYQALQPAIIPTLHLFSVFLLDVLRDFLDPTIPASLILSLSKGPTLKSPQ